jgi:hypothetical protein
LAFAQSTSRRTGGKYSLRISRPGMPNIQPWTNGINPPTKPKITSRIPKVILKVFLKAGR